MTTRTGDSDEITRPADAVSATAKTSPSPTQPSPPPLPPAASVNSKAGAEAARRYLLTAWAYGFQTGETLAAYGTRIDDSGH